MTAGCQQLDRYEYHKSWGTGEIEPEKATDTPNIEWNRMTVMTNIERKGKSPSHRSIWSWSQRLREICRHWQINFEFDMNFYHGNK